jgi:glucose uptake protein
MFIIESYTLAVFFCILTMLCWGSWANTLKLVSNKDWSFPLFYWDYSIGLILSSILFAISLGSFGILGRSFFADIMQANSAALGSAFLAGTIFNLSNLLIVAAISIMGMAVAFPLAVGLALVIGVMVNYLNYQEGNFTLLLLGVVFIVIAMVVNSIAYRKSEISKDQLSIRGIVIAVVSGTIMGFFYHFLVSSMSLNFNNPETGKMTPYSAVFVFAIGVFVSNFIWNTFFMYKPVDGKEPVKYSDFFTRGNMKIHLIGMLGGLIWNCGLLFSLISSEMAGPAISYGLGQGATMIAAAWGIFIWKEFKDSKVNVTKYIYSTFLFFILGIVLIIVAKNY